MSSSRRTASKVMPGSIGEMAHTLIRTNQASVRPYHHSNPRPTNDEKERILALVRGENPEGPSKVIVEEANCINMNQKPVYYIIEQPTTYLETRGPVIPQPRTQIETPGPMPLIINPSSMIMVGETNIVNLNEVPAYVTIHQPWEVSLETLMILANPPSDITHYVNAKQYRRILKRRIERGRLLVQGRIPAARPKYLHESRHRHALKRQRGSKGKFIGRTEDEEDDDDDDCHEENSSNTITQDRESSTALFANIVHIEPQIRVKINGFLD